MCLSPYRIDTQTGSPWLDAWCGPAGTVERRNLGLVTISPLSTSAPVVLIGPLAAGKTSVATVLSHLLNGSVCSVDDLRWKYLNRIGYDHAEAERRFAVGQTPAEKLAYREPFEVQVVEQVMAAKSYEVIDFGASNSVYEDPGLLVRVRTALLGAYVVLLLPSEDPEESERVLAARLHSILHAKGERVSDELLALNAYFIRHAANRQLADSVSYTSALRPADIANEIVSSLHALRQRP